MPVIRRRGRGISSGSFRQGQRVFLTPITVSKSRDPIAFGDANTLYVATVESLTAVHQDNDLTKVTVSRVNLPWFGTR